VTLAPERPVDTRPLVGCPRRRAAAATSTASPSQVDERPRLADGVRLLGEYAGTGYVEPQYLAVRGGGKQVQLSELLHLVADQCDGHSSYDEIARRVTDDYGKSVSADNVRTLVEDKLRPLGVLADAAGHSPQVEESDPLLGLKLRRQVLRPGTVRALARLASPAFWPPIVLAVLAGLALVDYWLFFVHGLGQGLRVSVQHPAVFLLVVGVVVVSAALHELGHAAACSYGGARPGGMGAGIYIVWPAFYTDVTDAYQLDRRGRLRTDLGGVYVNAIVVLVIAAVHAATHYEPLVLLMFLLQVQVLQQMLPFLRLDGYYVVSDLVGVPDLFRRIGPVLRSAIPFRKPEPEVAQLKPWVRRAVTGWVLVIVPILALNLGYILLAFPRIVATSWDSAMRLLGQFNHDAGSAKAWAGGQLLLLVLPAIGITYTMVRTARRGSTSAWRWSAGSPPRRMSVMTGGLLLLAALAFAWWPDGRVSPYRPGESGTMQQQVRELATVGKGTPLLRSPDQAQQPLAPVQAGHSAVLDKVGATSTGSTSTSGSTTSGSTTSGLPGSDSTPATTAPDLATSASPQASPAAVDSSPSPTVVNSPEPSPSPTG
jgi:putative peptide zinc metalloprotease protein